jgi:hypothetical protein
MIHSGATMSNIFNGQLNSIYSSTTTSTIINGTQNTIASDGYLNTILNGANNIINGHNSGIINGTGSTLNASNSVIIGVNNLTATTDNTVYVPNLNISLFPSEAAVSSLGVASNGMVVTATSMSDFASYGSFSNSDIQTLDLADTASAMTYNTSGSTNNITLLNGSQIKVSKSGAYNLAFSAQIDRVSGGAAKILSIWFNKNGSPISDSNTDVSISTATAQKTVAAWNIFLDLDADDFVEIMWSVTDTDIRLFGQGTQVTPTRPATPSIIATINRVG